MVDLFVHIILKICVQIKIANLNMIKSILNNKYANFINNNNAFKFIQGHANLHIDIAKEVTVILLVTFITQK